MPSSKIKSTPVSSANFREEKGRKLVRAISAESIYRCMLLFLDHILYCRALFVCDALSTSQAMLAIIILRLLSKSDGDILNASVRPSRYLLLNQWMEFNQTCYMTSPHCKGCNSNISFLFVHPTSPYVHHTIFSNPIFSVIRLVLLPRLFPSTMLIWL